MQILEEAAHSRGILAGPLDDISRRLVDARLTATPLAEFPGSVPDTLSAAYAVQSASIARWPDSVRGWKVGGIPPEFRDALGALKLSGPIFEPSVFSIESGGARAMPIFQGGFAAVEAEFVFKVGEPVAPTAQFASDAALINTIESLHIGAEIASSPMADVNRLGPCCVVCDFGNNAGLIVGPAIEDWQKRSPESMTAMVSVDGQTVGEATAASLEGGLLGVLRFLYQCASDREILLDAGTFVSCGALTGIHDVTTESRARVDFGQLGAFDVTFEPMAPIDKSPVGLGAT